MKILSFLRSLFGGNSSENDTSSQSKELEKEPQLTPSTEFAEPLLTVSQASKKNGVTRQAIFFAIKMKRLNAKKYNGTFLIAEKDLEEYTKTRYTRAKSRKNNELIFDKSKGFFSIGEAAKFLNKNYNQIYYLVRMGILKSHRQGSAIVIQDTEIYKYVDMMTKKSEKKVDAG
jgi:hypothetical protein